MSVNDMSNDQYSEFIARQNNSNLAHLASLDASLFDINVSLSLSRNLLSDFNQSSNIMALLRELPTESILDELRRRPIAELRPRTPSSTSLRPAYLSDAEDDEENEDKEQEKTLVIEQMSRYKTERMELKYGTYDIMFSFENILKKELDVPCANMCSICYDTPTKGASLNTECGHEFCRDCYIKWAYNNERAPSCPACRKSCPTFRMFKHRQQKLFVTNIKKGQQSQRQQLTTGGRIEI